MKLIGPALLILLVLTLFLAAAHVGLGGLYLNLAVRPVEVFALGVSIFIAFFLQHYFASTMSDRRREKDLLIDQLRDCFKTMRSSYETVNCCYEQGKLAPATKKQILAEIRRLINDIDALESALDISQFKGLIKFIIPVKSSYLDYKRAATGGRFPARPYGSQDMSNLERAYRALEKGLQKLVFEINKHP